MASAQTQFKLLWTLLIVTCSLNLLTSQLPHQRQQFWNLQPTMTQKVGKECSGWRCETRSYTHKRSTSAHRFPEQLPCKPPPSPSVEEFRVSTLTSIVIPEPTTPLRTHVIPEGSLMKEKLFPNAILALCTLFQLLGVSIFLQGAL